MNEIIPYEKDPPVYRTARALATAAFNTLLPITVIRQDRLMAVQPPYIIISNHRSNLDPVALAYAETRCPIHFIGKKELAETPVLKWIVKGLMMIPVDRHNSDMAAMRASLQVLREGHPLGIFPEGTRHHKGLMDELESGLAMIALRSGAPVIPVYIEPKIRFFRRTRLWIGEPIPTEDLRAQGINRETCDAFLRRVTETYARMAEEARAAQQK